MKYITHIIIILMLSYLIGLVIGLAGKINSVSNTEPLKQMIFKLDAEKDQCIKERDGYQWTIDSMSKNCN